MNVRTFYHTIYDIIGDLTPLTKDCGQLCGSACCAESDVGEGMYLFPREEKLFFPLLREKTFKIYKTDWQRSDGKCIYLYACNGTCHREARPLGCRIFPLVPFKLPGGALQVILDPRGAHGLCPLAAGSLSALDPAFVSAVTTAFAYAVKNKEVCAFIEEQTIEILLPLLKGSL